LRERAIVTARTRGSATLTTKKTEPMGSYGGAFKGTMYTDDIGAS
jgi:hypothetical protein